ncbi:MAG TPA: hypothetical protein VKG92_04525, partial [Flavobacteriales bacterium]|nr:hypothetical protein [Flavobacteriales bacterium]
MPQRVCFSLVVGSLFLPAFAQTPPVIQWQSCLGGTGWDVALSVAPTSSGGCIVAGYNGSYLGPDLVNHGASDFWFARLDEFGALLWQHDHGGSDPESAEDAAVLDNGDVLISGNTGSNGDLYENSGFAVVLRTNADGETIWQHTYGGSGGEGARSIKVTPDGGSIFVGNTNSMDGDVVGHHGGFSVGTTIASDIWVVKLDANGDIEWQHPLGGTDTDIGWEVALAANGGYLVCGYIESTDGDVTN